MQRLIGWTYPTYQEYILDESQNFVLIWWNVRAILIQYHFIDLWHIHHKNHANRTETEKKEPTTISQLNDNGTTKCRNFPLRSGSTVQLTAWKTFMAFVYIKKKHNNIILRTPTNTLQFHHFKSHKIIIMNICIFASLWAGGKIAWATTRWESQMKWQQLLDSLIVNQFIDLFCVAG